MLASYELEIQNRRQLRHLVLVYASFWVQVQVVQVQGQELELELGRVQGHLQGHLQGPLLGRVLKPVVTIQLRPVQRVPNWWDHRLGRNDKDPSSTEQAEPEDGLG